jgi:hypothetical protein
MHAWTRTIILTIAAAAFLSLAGCTGAMSIWGINVPIPGDDDDDDDDAPNLDFSHYDGTELINLDWSQEALEQGHFNCVEIFDAFGDNTTLDDGNLCPDCDEVWTITLVRDDEDMECVSQGTGLQIEETYVRKIGIEWIDSVNFRFYRNRQDSDMALDQHGIGAIDGVEFSWSGVDGWSEPYTERGFTLWFSGEGEF